MASVSVSGVLAYLLCLPLKQNVIEKIVYAQKCQILRAFRVASCSCRLFLSLCSAMLFQIQSDCWLSLRLTPQEPQACAPQPQPPFPQVQELFPQEQPPLPPPFLTLQALQPFIFVPPSVS